MPTLNAATEIVRPSSALYEWEPIMRFKHLCKATTAILTACLIKPALAVNGPYIFDWNIRVAYVAGMEDYTPLSHAGHDLTADHSIYPPLYNQLYAQDRPLGLMLQPDTNPLDGSKDPNALATVMSYVPRLDMVWADFEDANQDAQMQEVINQVRANPNPNINNAYVGNYNDYPGAVDYSAPWQAQVDRSARNAFYMNSGTNIANPSIYPYEFYENHTNTTEWGANVAPSKRAALFWAPLEKFSVAKRNLPDGHLLIPWTARFIGWGDGYTAPVPPREDVIAMIQHIRLRGADGYYRLISIIDNFDPNPVIDPNEEAQDRMDMLNGWHSLDSVFDNGGTPQILNLSTDKTSGLEWSGVQVGNEVAILISNLGNSTQRIMLPDIEGLPEYSDYVPSGQHLLHIYSVPEPNTILILPCLLLLSRGLLRRKAA
ncbi:MAG: hypothetical protein IT447_12985 [Phycisphaerales bacterium]|nr:hypothetical protein [Phycisphaerales bacterium]